MNILVQEYRRQFPNDSRSDDDVTLLLASQDDGTYAQYPDFTNDVARINAFRAASSELSKPTITGEIGRGFNRGMSSLAESAYGLGALGADVVGADSARDALLAKYKESQEDSASESNASAVPRVEDVKDLESGIRFALGKAGELIPQIGEVVVTGAAGAVIGSAVAPGAGTVAGGAGGLVEGFVARQSAKALIKAGIENLLSKSTLSAIERGVVKDQIESIAEKKAISGVVHGKVKELIAGEAKESFSKMGAVGSELANFYGIGAGTIYGDLANREGVDNEDARNAALVGGIGSALANAPLPLWSTPNPKSYR